MVPETDFVVDICSDGPEPLRPLTLRHPRGSETLTRRVTLAASAAIKAVSRLDSSEPSAEAPIVSVEFPRM